MDFSFKLKDIQEESRLIHFRLYCALVIIFLLIAIIAARLFYLQIIRHDHFSTLSTSNRVKVVPVAPIRGLIFSRDNVLVADNQFSFSLELIPEKIEDIDELIERLSKSIDIDDQSIINFKKLQRSKRYVDSVPLKLKLSETEVARFSVDRHKFPATKVTARPYRYYSQKAGLAHALGYVGRIDEKELLEIDTSDYLGTTHIGKLGVEKAYEDILHGSVGYQQVEVNAQGRIIRVLEKKPAEAGKNIYLTLDLSLQNVALKLLQGKKGAIVAMDPNNGDILALVSAPAYDPNLFVNGIDQRSYDALLNSKSAPLINRVLNGQYPPGSTIKPFLALVALELGIRDMHQETGCKGWYSLPGVSHRYRDWKVEGHGQVNLGYAIMQSCDVYFYSLANDLGIDRLHSALSNFGFGFKTGIDVGGEAAALNPSVAWKRRVHNEIWHKGDTIVAGIGQGYLLVTPLQLAMATARLVNHGKRVTPRLVDRIHDPVLGSSEQLSIKEEQTQSSSYKREHWDYIIQAMEDVAHGERGTARSSGRNAAYRFAGKTGTAQLFSVAQDEEYEKGKVPEHLQDHALFIAFAPVDAPEIVLAIIVENGGSGSATAAPMARQLFDHYLLDESGQLR